MRIQDLTNKTICIIGYGREGQAMHTALREHAPRATITIADLNEKIDAQNARLQTGTSYLQDLDRFDVIIRSSGVKDTPELDAVAHKTTDMTRIFFDSIQSSGVRTIGVTGSKGKSTTTSLIYEALRAHNPKVRLMGNIGIPMTVFLKDAAPGMTFVIELSSYMLEHLTVSPQVAVVTSFFAEHLDRHGSIDAYWEAKKNIALHQTADDVVFYNAAYPKCREIADASQGHKIGFTADDFPIPLSNTKFTGEHNRSNLAAAYKVAVYLDVPPKTALQALKHADPLPNRLQNIGVHGGIIWVNDSFSTAPEATIAGLQALGDNVGTLLVGGVDRGVDFSGLANYLVTSPVRNIVVFPDTGLKIRELVQQQTTSKVFFETASMDEAVIWAAGHTLPGRTVLLSSASPSFNLFKDFVVRGEAFVGAVDRL